MKLSLKTLLSAALLCVPAAQAETVWAKGVSADGGWYDANKKYAEENDGDNNLCYAATAANLITWWQDTFTVPSGVPDKLDKVWQTYKDASRRDEGGNIGMALMWWVSGVYEVENSNQAQYWLYNNPNEYVVSSLLKNNVGGYYWNRYGLEASDLKVFANVETISYQQGNIIYTTYYIDQQIYDVDLGQMLKDGMGIGLGLSSVGGTETLGHAVTLWGVDYDNAGSIAKLWLTDSDDAQNSQYSNPRLFSVDVHEDEQGFIVFDDESYAADKYGTVYVKTVNALNPKAFSVHVPEPATATLSLLALAGLAVRRRRK